MDDLDKLTQTPPEDEQRAVAKRADNLSKTQHMLELRTLAWRTQEDVAAEPVSNRPSFQDRGSVTK
jgi:hypothetical protein